MPPLIAIATQCFGPDVGGIETLMTGLADELSRRGKVVEVFADHVRAHGTAELRRPYPIHRFGFWRPLRRAMKRHAIARAAQRAGVAGVFADSWKSVSAVPASVGPIAALAHGMEFPVDAAPLKSARINAALRRCTAIIASSRYAAELVEPFLHGVEAQIIVVNPPIAAQPAARPDALAQIDAIVAGRAPVLSTLARLDPRKGVDAVLCSLPALRARHPGLVYLVAGAGPDAERLRLLAARSGVADAVVFLGRVDDAVKAALLTRSDVFAMPTRRVGNSVEGFGIAYVEAGWYGAPSVAGDEGGARDAVADKETGLICHGDDDNDVCRALAQLLDDEALRKTYGDAAARAARRKFGWCDALPRYLAALGL
jgi:phosphatidylinositol alpha-1,6-mannosyltransferase